MTEKEKMLAGKIYAPSDDGLAKLRIAPHRLSKDYSNTYEDEEEKRGEIIKKLVPDRKRRFFQPELHPCAVRPSSSFRGA